MGVPAQDKGADGDLGKHEVLELRCPKVSNWDSPVTTYTEESKEMMQKLKGGERGGSAVTGGLDAESRSYVLVCVCTDWKSWSTSCIPNTQHQGRMTVVPVLTVPEKCTKSFLFVTFLLSRGQTRKPQFGHSPAFAEPRRG